MNPHVGAHPDANLLSAYAEGALGLDERCQVAEHLAGCDRCREVLFLAADAATHPAEPVVAKAPTAVRSRTAWLPIAAGAAIAACLCAWLLFPRLTSKPQGSSPRPQIATAAGNSPAPVTKPPMLGAITGSSAYPARNPKAPSRPAPSVSREPFGGFSSLASPSTAQARSAQSLPSVASQALPGHAAPAAAGEQTDKELSAPLIESSNMPSLPEIEEHRRAAESTQTATLQLLQQDPHFDGATPAARRISYKVRDGALERHEAGFARILTLPAGSRAFAVATTSRALLALDERGDLFLSHDFGNHWNRVAPQWTGKAVSLSSPQPFSDVQLEPASHDSPFAQSTATQLLRREAVPGKEDVARGKSATAHRAVVFELRNDRGELWVSCDDGKTWEPR